MNGSILVGFRQKLFFLVGERIIQGNLHWKNRTMLKEWALVDDPNENGGEKWKLSAFLLFCWSFSGC